MRNAIQIVIPECQLIGCWFHFFQRILRFVQTHGMVTLFRENHHVATILKMIMSLPHLPPQQMPEFPEFPGNFLKNCYSELSVQVSPLLKHAVSLHRRMPQSRCHALRDDYVVDILQSDYFLGISTLMQ
eukprot:XP_016663517.1 PREDICTED: uncharacterized protein LOC107884920 [Acyrthosiphon pisum]